MEDILLLNNENLDELSLLDYFKDATQLTFDIETYAGLNSNGLDFRKGKIRLIQICDGQQTPIVIDCKDKMFCFDVLIQELRILFADKTKTLLAQNGLFDLTFLRQQFNIISHTRYLDTRTASQLLYAGVEGVSHSLKAIVKRTLGLELSKQEQISDWGLPLLASQLNYAVKDVIYTSKAMVVLKEQLIEAKILPTCQIECGAIPVFAEMQIEGLPVDVELLEDTIKQYTDFIENAQQLWQKTTGLAFTAAPAKKLEALHAMGIKNEEGKPLEDCTSASLAHHRNNPVIRSLWLATTAKMSLNYLLNIKKSLFNKHFSGGSYRPLAAQALGRSSCGDDKISTNNTINHQCSMKYPDIKEFREADLPNIRKVFSVKPISSTHSLIGMDLAAA
jgi:hypothetical protein